jgi:hypothetical protein
MSMSLYVISSLWMGFIANIAHTDGLVKQCAL